MNKSKIALLALFAVSALFLNCKTAMSEDTNITRTDSLIHISSDLITGEYNIESAATSGNYALSTYTNFYLAPGNTANMIFPNNVQYYINRMDTNAFDIQGTIYGRLGSSTGPIGGHLIFISPAGITIGPNATINVGSLTLTTANSMKIGTSVVPFDLLGFAIKNFGSNDVISYENISDTGSINNQGKIYTYTQTTSISSSNNSQINLLAKDIDNTGMIGNYSAISGISDTVNFENVNYDTKTNIVNLISAKAVEEEKISNTKTGGFSLSTDSSVSNKYIDVSDYAKDDILINLQSDSYIKGNTVNIGTYTTSSNTAEVTGINIQGQVLSAKDGGKINIYNDTQNGVSDYIEITNSIPGKIAKISAGGLDASVNISGKNINIGGNATIEATNTNETAAPDSGVSININGDNVNINQSSGDNATIKASSLKAKVNISSNNDVNINPNLGNSATIEASSTANTGGTDDPDTTDANAKVTISGKNINLYGRQKPYVGTTSIPYVVSTKGDVDLTGTSSINIYNFNAIESKNTIGLHSSTTGTINFENQDSTVIAPLLDTLVSHNFPTIKAANGITINAENSAQTGLVSINGNIYLYSGGETGGNIFSNGTIQIDSRLIEINGINGVAPHILGGNVNLGSITNPSEKIDISGSTVRIGGLYDINLYATDKISLSNTEGGYLILGSALENNITLNSGIIDFYVNSPESGGSSGSINLISEMLPQGNASGAGNIKIQGDIVNFRGTGPIKLTSEHNDIYITGSDPNSAGAVYFTNSAPVEFSAGKNIYLSHTNPLDSSGYSIKNGTLQNQGAIISSDPINTIPDQIGQTTNVVNTINQANTPPMPGGIQPPPAPAPQGPVLTDSSTSAEPGSSSNLGISSGTEEGKPGSVTSNDKNDNTQSDIQQNMITIKGKAIDNFYGESFMNALVKNNSKENEFRADLNAVEDLAQLGYHPAGIAGFLMSVKSIEDKSGKSNGQGNINSLFTYRHPDTSDRLLKIGNEIRILSKEQSYSTVINRQDFNSIMSTLK